MSAIKKQGNNEIDKKIDRKIDRKIDKKIDKINRIDRTARALKYERQRKNRLELNLAFQRDQLRKADARRKIQLGGLIVKANLADEKTAVLLGLLVEAKKKLETKKGQSVRAAWGKIGDELLTAEQLKENNEK